MIIYGYREATLQSGIFEGAVCPHCGQQGHVAGAVYSRHAHMMWIPLFPFYKRMDIWCQQCGGQSQTMNYPVEIQDQMKSFKRAQKPRIWQFIGLFLLVVFIGSIILSGQREKSDTKKYFEAPILNDVYCVEYEDEYSLMIIAEIQEDSVYFYDNEYYMSNMSDAKKLHRPDFYEQEVVYGYSKDELQKLYSDKMIHHIWRDLPYSTEELDLEESIIKEDSESELATEDSTDTEVVGEGATEEAGS